MIGVSGFLSFYAHDPSLDLASLTPCQIEDAIRDGRARRVSSGSNLIVTSGLAALAAKLGHALNMPTAGGQTVTALSELQVSEMQLGNAVSPASPSAGDTALDDGTPVYTITSLTVSYPSSGTVRFSGTIPPNTINGEGITETGVFFTINSNKVMLGRRLMDPVVVIAPSTAYTATYDVTFTAA